MKHWAEVYITGHAIDRYIQRVRPGISRQEAEETLRSQLRVAKHSGVAAGGGVAWALPEPFAYAVIARDRTNKRKLVLNTILLPEQLKQGRQLQELLDVAEEAGIEGPSVGVEAPEVPDNVRGIRSDGDMVLVLSELLDEAKAGNLLGVTVGFQRTEGPGGYTTVTLPDANRAVLIGELELAKHVMVAREALRYGLL